MGGFSDFICKKKKNIYEKNLKPKIFAAEKKFWKKKIVKIFSKFFFSIFKIFFP